MLAVARSRTSPKSSILYSDESFCLTAPHLVVCTANATISCGGVLEFSRLRLRGFKSFSDEADLPIGEGLTGIVGPNGCGKSNVVEALRWVMGESSARDLRGGEMDDVVFGGSALRPSFDIAEVALMVSNAASTTASEQNSEQSNVFGLAEARASHWGSDLEITRRIERGSGSTYRINKREVRARDVQLIFADAAAGSRSPAIISQGRVTSIIESKPEDRRRLLEDAAGIGGLHSRRREAELKLNATEANLSRVRDRLADLEQDLKGLRRQAKEAERYRQVAEEISYFEQLLLLARVVEAEADAAKAETFRAQAENRCVHWNDVLEAAVINVGSLARQLPDLQAEITRLTGGLAGGRERLSRLQEAAAVYNRDVTRIEQALAAARSEAQRLGQTLEAKSLALPAARKALAAATAERDASQSQTPHLQTHLNELQSLASTARQELQAALSAIATNEAELAENTRLIASHTMRQTEIEAEMVRAMNLDDDALVKVAERQLAEATQRLDEATGEQAMAEDQLQETVTALVAKRQAVENTRQRSSAATEKWRALDNERLRLEALLAAFSLKETDLEQRRDYAAGELQRLDHDLEQNDVVSFEQALEQSRIKSEQLTEELVHAKDEVTRAQEHQQANIDQLTSLRELRDRDAQELTRLRSEAQALGAVQEDSDPEPVLNGLLIDAGYEAALSAALGDDLLVGTADDRPRFWHEIEAGMLPGWPTKLKTLDQVVHGVPALALRLAMVAVCESSAQAQSLQSSLQPGQRLVTIDGGLWRWDGFVQQPDAGKAAQERVRQRRRQAELGLLVPKLELSLGDREADLIAGDAAATAANLVAEEAKRNLTTLEHRLDETHREMTRLDEQLSDRRNRLERLSVERLRIVDEQERVTAELSALSSPDGIDPAEQRADVEQSLAAKHSLACDLEALIAQLRDTEAQETQHRNRLTAVSNTVANARQAVSQAETLFERRRGEAEGRRQSRELAIEGLNRDLRAISEDLAKTAATGKQLQITCQQLGERRATALSASQNYDTELETIRTSVAEQAGSLSRLHERIRSGQGECERLAREVAELEDANAEAAEKLKLLIDEADTIALHAEQHGAAANDAMALEHRLTADARALEERKAELIELERAHSDAVREKEQAAEEAIRAREQLAAAQNELTRIEDLLEAHVEAAERGIDEPPAKLLANERIRDALAKSTVRQVESQLDKHKSKRDGMGAVNLRATAEIGERETTFQKLQIEEGELSAAIERLSAAIQDLDREARKRLIVAFEKVDEHFRRLFAKLFGGGKAHLRLTNIDVPGKAGLELDAMPPGKKLQNISLLSGGEKGMTALALVFALFLSQPSPLCVLDEVDAALDDANVERFVEMMVDIAGTTGTRFIVVTHHPLTMARMDRLFGVTMIERGVSRLVSVSLSTAIDIRTTA